MNPVHHVDAGTDKAEVFIRLDKRTIVSKLGELSTVAESSTKSLKNLEEVSQGASSASNSRRLPRKWRSFSRERDPAESVLKPGSMPASWKVIDDLRQGKPIKVESEWNSDGLLEWSARYRTSAPGRRPLHYRSESMGSIRRPPPPPPPPPPAEVLTHPKLAVYDHDPTADPVESNGQTLWLSKG